MVAHTKSEQLFDISFICKDCKLEYDKNVLPRCEKCDRLMRNKSLCYCHKEKKKQTQSLTNRELVAQSFSFCLESKTRELEKKLSPQELVDKLNAKEEEINKLKVQLNQLQQ